MRATPVLGSRPHLLWAEPFDRKQGRADSLHPDAQPCSYESHCRWHHAWMMRLPHVLVGFTRMKCAGTPSIHGSSPAPTIDARSASVSR